MNTIDLRKYLPVIAPVILMAAIFPSIVLSHCDSMNGPVVQAAKEALSTGNVNLVLIWVQKDDEAALREAFAKTLAVRGESPEARALADMYFFETLVRLHRAGEGAAYTGLKPAGTAMEPGIAAADEAVASGSADHLLKALTDAMQTTLTKLHREVLEKKRFAPDAIEAGRAYVRSYVEFIHYVERLHEAATVPPEGHGPETGHEQGLH
jgi:hypothetical protein